MSEDGGQNYEEPEVYILGTYVRKNDKITITWSDAIATVTRSGFVRRVSTKGGQTYIEFMPESFNEGTIPIPVENITELEVPKVVKQKPKRK